MNLLTKQSVAHTLLIISLVISVGLELGEIPFFKIKQGIAGVLFSDLAFGHFGIAIDPHIMHFFANSDLFFLFMRLICRWTPVLLIAFYRMA